MHRILCGAAALLLALVALPGSLAQAQTTLPPEVALGRPPQLDAPARGASAFWVWTDGGGVWHLRVTAPQPAQFVGWVSGSGDGTAQLMSVTSIGLENGILQDQNGLDFEIETASGGFDFYVQGGGCVRFYLFPQLDQAVLIGANQVPAPQTRFQVCPES